MKTILVLIILCLLLTACSTKKVNDMGYNIDTDLYWIDISDIGKIIVKPSNYALCGIGDYIKIMGHAYGKGYNLVKCWSE